MKKHTALFLVAVIVMVFSLSACGAVSGLSDVKSTGDAFMTALKNGDHSTSWNMLTPAVQEELGSQEFWVEWATIRSFPEWKFTNTQIDNNEGQLDGEATLDGITYDVTLVFEKIGDAWLISGINFQDQ